MTNDAQLDPLISLAFSVHSNPGVYALLLGSGLSRAAQIPTGWQITLDLAQKIADITGESPKGDPESWYREQFDSSPNYSELIERLAKSPAERNALLKPYFEPTDEENERGIKTPSEAHRAIAELVAGGYIKVIVTTNFDRLMERALEERGIVSTVISTPDAATGALPLAHVRCTILKVNGDYMDVRIKNTPDELAQYAPPLNRLLDQIFDEYGLIVCGWSAEWDTALRAALERRKSKRFSAYWTLYNETSKTAQRLIRLQQAEPIEIEGADKFFVELSEKVSALEALAAQPHPLTTRMAAATTKRYLAESRYRIQLHDFTMSETSRVVDAVRASDLKKQWNNNDEFTEGLRLRIQQYEALTKTLRAIHAAGCFWGDKSHVATWLHSLSLLADMPQAVKGIHTVWTSLLRYPALLVCYSGGIAAVSAQQYTTLASLLTKLTVKDKSTSERLPLILSCYPERVLESQFAQRLEGLQRHFTPLSDHLFRVLRETLKDYLPTEDSYQEAFDRFEYLLSLVHADLYQRRHNRFWGPIGCFAWRGRDWNYSGSVMRKLATEANEAGAEWNVLQAGLFDGSLSRFNEVHSGMQELITHVPWR